jgi:hypothetical protein
MTNLTDSVDAVSYPEVPNIWIAYPSPKDWKRLFNPVFDKKRAADIHWQRSKYDHMRRAHEDEVTNQLRVISGRNTGRTILQLFRLRSGHSVMILPFVFMDDPSDVVASTIPIEEYAATAKGERMLDKDGSKHWLTERKFDGTIAKRGTGTGSSVDVYYPRANPLGLAYSTDETDDEILLHELVHAFDLWGPAPSPCGIWIPQ